MSERSNYAVLAAAVIGIPVAFAQQDPGDAEPAVQAPLEAQQETLPQVRQETRPQAEQEAQVDARQQRDVQSQVDAQEAPEQARAPQQGADVAADRASVLPEELRRPCAAGVGEIEDQLRDKVIPTDVREDVESLLRRARSAGTSQCAPIVAAARDRLGEYLPTEIDAGAAQPERFVPRAPETATVDNPNVENEPPEPLVLEARVPRELERQTDDDAQND